MENEGEVQGFKGKKILIGLFISAFLLMNFNTISDFLVPDISFNNAVEYNTSNNFLSSDIEVTFSDSSEMEDITPEVYFVDLDYDKTYFYDIKG